MYFDYIVCSSESIIAWIVMAIIMMEWIIAEGTTYW